MELKSGGPVGPGSPAPLAGDTLQKNLSSLPSRRSNSMDQTPFLASEIEVETSYSDRTPSTFQPNYYQKNATGPFIVYMQYNPPSRAGDESEAVRNLTTNALTVGKLIFDRAVKGVESLKKIGRNRIEIKFSTSSEANAFTSLDFLTEKNYRAFVPAYTTFRTGLIKGIDTALTDEEIVEGLNKSNSIQAHKIRRLNFRDKSNGVPTWKPSRTIVVTFEGQKLPERVFLYYNSLPVEPYSLPVMQCLNCCRFGHSHKSCRAKFPRCFKCTGEHSGFDCESEKIKCANCESIEHFANSFRCEEYVRQKKIKHLMSTDNTSYFDAASRFPKKALFSTVVSSYTSAPKAIPNTNRSIHRPRIIVSDPPRSQHARGLKKRKATHNTSISPQGCSSPKFTWDNFPISSGNGVCLDNPHKNQFLDVASLLDAARQQILAMRDSDPSLANSTLSTLITMLDNVKQSLDNRDIPSLSSTLSSLITVIDNEVDDGSPVVFSS